jgi:hypothetical protein
VIHLKDVHVVLGLTRLCSLAVGDAVTMADQNRGRVADAIAALKPHERLCRNCTMLVGGALNLGPAH